MRRSTSRAALARPGVHAVWTAADVADIPPIDFPPDPHRRARALPPAAACERLGALCRRAGRGRFCGRPVSRRRCRRTCRGGRSKNCRSFCTPHDAARRIRARPIDRACASSARAMATSTPPSAPRMPLSPRRFRSAAIPACRWKRAAPSRATTRRATCSSCTAPPRCRIGTETSSPACLDAAASPFICYEGHVGGGFGIRGEIYPEDVLVCAAALRLQRPIKWIEDRREHLIAANHSRQQHHQRPRRRRSRRAHSRASTTNFSRSGRLYAHPCGDRPRSRRRHAAGPLSHSGLSRQCPYPADQQNAVRNLSRAGPVREHLRARAAHGRDRRQARFRSRSKSADAI